MEKHELAARLRTSTGKHDDIAAIQQHTIDALRERLAASEGVVEAAREVLATYRQDMLPDASGCWAALRDAVAALHPQ